MGKLRKDRIDVCLLLIHTITKISFGQLKRPEIFFAICHKHSISI